jgi:cytochrome c peroxidase
MVPLMARYQLGKQVTPEQVADIIAFLHTLTGEIPVEYISLSALPQ